LKYLQNLKWVPTFFAWKSLLKPYQNDALLPFLRDSGKKKKAEPESPKAQYGEKYIKPLNRLTRR